MPPGKLLLYYSLRLYSKLTFASNVIRLGPLFSENIKRFSSVRSLRRLIHKSDKPQAATLNSLGRRNYRQKPESPPHSATINYADIVIINHCYEVIVDVSFKDV